MEAVRPIPFVLRNMGRQTEETLGKSYWISYTAVTWEVASVDYWHACWYQHLQKRWHCLHQSSRWDDEEKEIWRVHPCQAVLALLNPQNHGENTMKPSNIQIVLSDETWIDDGILPQDDLPDMDCGTIHEVVRRNLCHDLGTENPSP